MCFCDSGGSQSRAQNILIGWNELLVEQSVEVDKKAVWKNVSVCSLDRKQCWANTH